MLISIPAASDSNNHGPVSFRFTSFFTICLVPLVERTGGVKLRPPWAEGLYVPGSTGPSLVPRL